jgi:hypothetical protein
MMTPSFITKNNFCIYRMFCRGSPEIARISALVPDASIPDVVLKT